MIGLLIQIGAACLAYFLHANFGGIGAAIGVVLILITWLREPEDLEFWKKKEEIIEEDFF